SVSALRTSCPDAGVPSFTHSLRMRCCRRSVVSSTRLATPETLVQLDAARERAHVARPLGDESHDLPVRPAQHLLHVLLPSTVAGCAKRSDHEPPATDDVDRIGALELW